MSWLVSNFGEVWQLTVDHVALSVLPVILGFLLSLPIGSVANRYRASRGTLLSISGILYAIPSLPLFMIMPSIIGTKILDPANVVIALIIYALAIMVRATADALAAVENDVRLSASAVGYSGWQRFWGVELPLAGPALLASVRVVSVSTISLVSVGSVVGVQSLGHLFLDGFNRDIPDEIVIGIVGTILIALFFDAILVLLGRILMPWNRRERRSRGRSAEIAVEAVSAA